MLDPKFISDLDQFGAYASEALVPLMYNFYQSCLKEGFTNKEAEKMVAILLHEIFNGNQSGKMEYGDKE